MIRAVSVRFRQLRKREKSGVRIRANSRLAPSQACRCRTPPVAQHAPCCVHGSVELHEPS